MTETACISVDVEREFSSGPAQIGNRVEQILGLFEEYRVRATFFVSGDLVCQNPGWLRDAAERHEVAAHGYEHRNLRTLGRAGLEREIRRVQKAFEKAGLECRGFRCPYLIIPEGLGAILSRNRFCYDSSRLSSPFSPQSLRYPLSKHQIVGIEEVPLQVLSPLRFPLNLSFLRLAGPGNIRRILPARVRTFYFHQWELNPRKDIEGYSLRKQFLFNLGDGAVLILRRLFEILKERRVRYVCCDEAASGQTGTNINHSSGRPRI